MKDLEKSCDSRTTEWSKSTIENEYLQNSCQ